MSFVPMPPGSPSPALPPLYELEPAPPPPPLRGGWRNALYRSRWLSLGIIAACAGAALAATHFIPPYYEASGSIIIQYPSLHNAELTPQEFPPPVDLDRELQTELTVMGSYTVVDPVMAQLRLEQRDPEIRRQLAAVNRSLANQHERLSAEPSAQLAYGVFSSKLKLLPDKLSNTVQVVYGSQNAALAAEVVNALTAQFLRETLAAREATGQQTSAWMRQQLAAAQRQLAADDQAVADFQRAHAFIPLAEGGAAESGLLARLSDAEHAWSTAQAARLGDEAALRSYSGAVVSAPEDLRNPAIDRAANDVGAAEQQLSALATTYRPDFPLVVEARAQLTAARHNLAGLQAEVRQALEQRLAASQRREQEMAAAVNGLERQAAAASGVQLQYGVLQARADGQRGVIAGLEPKLAEIEMEATLPPANIRMLDRALPPMSPAYPQLPLDLGLGLGLGVLAALGVALGREHFSQTLTQSEMVTQRLGPALAPLGMIADHPAAAAATRALPPAAGELAASDGYSKVAANLVARCGPPPRVLLITSPNPGEGKTSSVCRLAMALAQGGWRTLVADADLARPACHSFFGLSNATGLATAQAGRKVAPLAVAPHLDLMPCEEGTNAPLQARAMAGLLEEWREHYDYILVDSPPGGLSGDAVLLSSLVEGVVVVLRWGRTRLPEAERLCEELARARAPLLGTLLNRADPQAPAFRAYRRMERP